MNNTLIRQLGEAKEKGMRQGILIGLDLCAIALNHKFGFGKERLKVLTAEVQDYLDEMGNAKDMERVWADITKELIAIWGDEGKDFFLRRYVAAERGIR